MSGVTQADPPISAPSAKAEIRALTGVRILAALWVVFFHIRGNIASESTALGHWIGPLIAHGELGVDLFFSLSGFVLALNYVDKMGLKLDRHRAATFLWARVARVWPVFFVTLLAAGLLRGVLLATGVGDPVPTRDFSVPSFFRQTLLVALWTESDHDRLMWNGPSWSVSAEAFAYALFPILVLLFFRLGRVLSARILALFAIVCVLPVTLFVGALGSLYFPWSWMLRIVCGFTAGALMYLAVRKVNVTLRLARWASIGAVGLILFLVVWLYFFDWTGRGERAPMIAPIFVVLVGLLAVGDRYLSRLLATQVFVVGGAASYSVYMVHMLVIEPFWWLQGHVAFFAPGTLPSKLGFALIPFVVIALGYALWRWFEEPARKLIRRMSTEHRPGAVLGPIVADPLNDPPADSADPSLRA